MNMNKSVKKMKHKKKDKSFDKVDIQHNENKIVNIKKNLNKDTTIIPGYCNATYYKEYNPLQGNCNKCWNCIHDVTTDHVSIPLKYNDNIFYLYGNFCSYECSARYILDTYSDKNMWDIYSLLNLYYNICNKTKGKKVSPAPNKLLLNVFGGTMGIDEYRSKFNSCNIYDIYQPPIIPIKYNTVLLENKNPTENKHNFKLYRKKPINTSNNIYNTMNLTTTDNDGIVDDDVDEVDDVKGVVDNTIE
jgi:hypothetical protein